MPARESAIKSEGGTIEVFLLGPGPPTNNNLLHLKRARTATIKERQGVPVQARPAQDLTHPLS